MHTHHNSTSARRWFEAVAGIQTCVLCGQHGVQVSHSNLHRGLGQKSKPYMTAALCRDCHYDIDNGTTLSNLERRELHARAINLTHARLVETGRLVLA